MSCLTLGCAPPTPGSRRSHCGGCHHTFSGLTAFDHQTLDRSKTGYPVICLPPTAFLNLIQRPDGVWRLPGERPDGSFPASGDDRDGRTPQTLGAVEGREVGEAQKGPQAAEWFEPTPCPRCGDTRTEPGTENSPCFICQLGEAAQ